MHVDTKTAKRLHYVGSIYTTDLRTTCKSSVRHLDKEPQYVTTLQCFDAEPVRACSILNLVHTSKNVM